MKEKIKDFFYGLGGIGFIVLVMVGFALLIIGGAKLFEFLYPFLEKISGITWVIVWLLVVLSIVPRFRKLTGTGIVLGTYIGGAIFWFLCFYITYALWGLLGIFIGVLLFGLGVFLTAILALLFSGQFMEALLFLFTFLQIILLRYFGYWIITKYKPKKDLYPEKDSSTEKYIAIPAKNLSKKPLSLGVVFLSIFLFIVGAIEIFTFLKNTFLNMRIIWGGLSIVSGIGLLWQKFWAYRLTQALLIINIITSPLFLASPDFSFGSKLIMVLISITLSGFILWYLSRRKTKEQFLDFIFTHKPEKQENYSPERYERKG